MGKAPDAVCIELDKIRFDALEQGLRGNEDVPFIFKRLQKIYDKAAESQGASVGEEMLGAVEAARIMNIPYHFIDIEASPMVMDIFQKLTLGQKTKLMGSVLVASVLPKKKMEEGIKQIEENPLEAIKQFEKAFPELKRDLVDYRDTYMSKRLIDISKRFDNIVAVVGEGHIQGIEKNLKKLEYEVIHLSEVLEMSKQMSGVKVKKEKEDGVVTVKQNTVSFSFDVEYADLVEEM
ncbi:MAG: TraB/GumN family protein [Thermoplasmata archaeon]|nr:TraB/GumN family protein [Thermoplasmata archaeon]